ncbi:hypothetical protein [Haloarcula marismortui]|uniref:Uncharacterized protein n=1 Tax=Haloarcula marismortui ATCC 33799 TaxID=662475 RepID=M0K7U9_9EURY|nr:hypothetical protein [Haloarcula californiae]EMA17286.1 hypothetical protein C435_11315 [Haloarcula californiae ATCC 33799]
MFEELAARMETIAQNTNVKVFTVSNWQEYFYPYALAHEGYADEKVRKACYELIVDSNKNDPETDNADVVERANQVNADYIIPKDYIGDQSRTHDSMVEFQKQYESECRAKPYYVLQPPFDYIYTEHEDFYSSINRFALGGLQGLDDEMQVKEIKRFREVAHDGITVHGFGVGTSVEIIRACREHDTFLDSLDIGTPEQSVINNAIVDAKMSQFEFEIPRGTRSTNVRAAFAKAILQLLNYLLSPLPSEEYMNEFYGYDSVEAAVTDQGSLSHFDAGLSNDTTA